MEKINNLRRKTKKKKKAEIDRFVRNAHSNYMFLQESWSERKWKLLSCVLLFGTPWTRVHGILHARILEWVTIPSSRRSSQPRDWTQVSSLQADSLPAEPQGKPKNTGVGSLFFFRQIFPTQEWKMEPGSSALQADSLPTEQSGTQYKIKDRIKV